jgi:hypothetical protein
VAGLNQFGDTHPPVSPQLPVLSRDHTQGWSKADPAK